MGQSTFITTLENIKEDTQKEIFTINLLEEIIIKKIGYLKISLFISN